MGDENDKPATEQFENEPDPEHDEVATNDPDDDEGTPDESDQKHVVTEGEFERELHLDREATADFLEDLADQLRAGTTLTVSGDDWELPFEYAEPIEVEIEHEDEDDDRELEIELEFDWGGDGDDLEVE